MHELENRIVILERLAANQARTISDLMGRMARAELQKQAGGSGGGSNSGGGAFTAIVPGGGIAGGAVAACSVYSVTGSTETAVSGTPNVYNPMPDACIAGRKLVVTPDGSGGYMAQAESCS